MDIAILKSRAEEARFSSSDSIAGAVVVAGLAWKSFREAFGKDPTGKWAFIGQRCQFPSELEVDRLRLFTSVRGRMSLTKPEDLDGLSGLLLIDGAWDDVLDMVRFNSWVCSIAEVLTLQVGTNAGFPFPFLRKPPDPPRMHAVMAVAYVKNVVDGTPLVTTADAYQQARAQHSMEPLALDHPATWVRP